MCFLWLRSAGAPDDGLNGRGTVATGGAVPDVEGQGAGEDKGVEMTHTRQLRSWWGYYWWGYYWYPTVLLVPAAGLTVAQDKGG